METEPNEGKEQEGSGHSEDDHPGNVHDPGNVTVDEPTDPALSGTSADDFTGGGEPNEERES